MDDRDHRVTRRTGGCCDHQAGGCLLVRLPLCGAGRRTTLGRPQVVA
ncbi:hypothetical protein [Streptomyces sp. NPDC091268]